MRILRVITTMNPERGGPCQGIRNSIPILQNMGIHNEVVSFDMPGESFLGKDNFSIHPLGPHKSPYNYCPNLDDWLMENLNRFDVVIIHGLWLYNSYGTYRAWKKYKRRHLTFPRLYVMPHGMLDPYFQRAADRKLKAIRNIFIWYLLEKNIINGVDGVLFTCEQELILARETFNGYNPKSELNIKYGILPPPLFCQEMQSAFVSKMKILDDVPYWLFLSRIHEKKGVDLLISAYLRLKEKGYNVPVLVIAGPGLDSSYGREMMNLASEDNSILFPGMLTGNEKWGAIYGAEVFILPSHQENFGISIVEAMACGTPVLISDQVNIWSEIIKGHAGLVCKDVEQSVFDILEQWINFSSSEKQIFKIDALETYSEYFTVEKASNQMAQVLQLK